MANRRSLAAAIDFSADKMAFIKEGPPETSVPVPARSEAPKEEAREAASDEVAVRDVPEVRPSRRSRNRRQVRSQAPEDGGAFLGVANLLSPLTTRLQPSTYAALKRAGLEQKLRGQEPG